MLQSITLGEFLNRTLYSIGIDGFDDVVRHCFLCPCNAILGF